MGDFLKDLLDEFPKNPDIDKAEVFCSDKIVLFKANSTVDQEASLKNSYSFIIMGQESFSIKIENKKFVNERNKLIPINPGQTHSGSRAKVVSQYIPVFIEKDFLSELTYHMLGKYNVLFRNCNYSISTNITYLINEFIKESSLLQPGSDLIMQCLNSELAINILRCVDNLITENPLHDKKLVKLTEDYLRNNYLNKLSLNEIARHANYSPYHFIKIFRNETGKTPIEYLLDVKIEKAEKLLRDKRLSIIEVCYASGFNNPSYFSNIFKRKKGVSPSAYRNNL